MAFSMTAAFVRQRIASGSVSGPTVESIFSKPFRRSGASSLSSQSWPARQPRPEAEALREHQAMIGLEAAHGVDAPRQP
jgi:hypothetical protein